MSEYTLHTIDAGDTEYIRDRLIEFNLSKVPPILPFNSRDFSFKMVDASDKIAAGITGYINAWGVLHIELFFVDETLRGEGLGTKLLSHAEAEARALGCSLVRLETYDFQAKDFYLKNGYELFGTLSDSPPGHEEYFLKKAL